MKFLVDMNLSPRWCDILEEASFETVHWGQIDKANSPDEMLVDWAREHGCAIITNDLDFGHLMALSTLARPSIVQVRGGDLTPETIGLLVVAAIRASVDSLRSGAILTIDSNRVRLRLLPFSAFEQ